jgi:hypothetical protein
MSNGHPSKPALLALLGTASLLGACADRAGEVGRIDRLALGRNAAGDPCTATRTTKDSTLTSPFDFSFAIACRNVSASRSIGFLRSTPDPRSVARIEDALSCGAATSTRLDGVGGVEVRRCLDKSVGEEVIAVRFERGDRTVIGTAVPSILGPFEDGLRQMAGAAPAGGSDRATPATIQIASLAAPAAAAGPRASGEFDPAIALQEGISLNHRGLHSEASRLLNDALSRVTPGVPPATRAELFLEAALADSNIRFRDSAAAHFARADALINSGEGAESPLLLRKRDTYRALDLLNRRQFRNALAALERLLLAPTKADQPLQNIAVIRALNQGSAGERDASNALATGDVELQTQLLLDAQANWARSIALRTLGDTDGAARALTAAEASFEPLSLGRADQAQILWLKARIERQRGRLAASKGDWATATGAFDRAVAALEQAAVENEWTGKEPAIADVKLERASILAQQGTQPDVVRREFAEAVDTMVASSAAGSIGSSGLDRYLDILIQEAEASPREDTYELYFRALQAVGEPAVARQLNKLQTVVTADPALGAKFRDRADLEREITRLRYQIDAAADTAARSALEARRAEAQTKLQAIENALSGDRRASSIDDRAATVAEIRAALRPGETYLKITEIGRRAFAMVVGKDRTFIYAVEAPSDALNGLASIVRNSIDGKLETERKLVPFEVQAAHGLFTLITGPAQEAILASSALVVEPSGPLERLPAGVLVTDSASVERYKPRRRSRDTDELFDYSDISFLASKAELSTAVSPRSFLVARSLPPSTAAKPFIGFAEHSPASGDKLPASGEVQVGNACSANVDVIRDYLIQAKPISRAEVKLASAALGFPDAPLIAGSDFTDQAVEGREDLDQYQVLHFATHGLEEGVWGCAKSPPALITSIEDVNSDGLLSFDEIARLRLDANLVVLSACETASGVKDEALARQSGQEEAGSTLEGLVRAFLTANARAVLATYWQVSADEETNELVRTLYTTARQQTIGASLQTAQRRLMTEREYSHPFYWGAYFVVGDSSKMMLSPSGAPVQTASK